MENGSSKSGGDGSESWWETVSLLWAWLVCGEKALIIPLREASIPDFWQDTRKEESKLHGDSGAKKAWVWWSYCGKLRKKWTCSNNIPGNNMPMSHGSVHFQDPRLWWGAKADTVPAFTESNNRVMTVSCSSMLHFWRRGRIRAVWEKPPPRTAVGAICFLHSVFLLKGCVAVRNSWSHSRQQLGIQTWFRIPSHGGLAMQITQKRGKSDEPRVSTPG